MHKESKGKRAKRQKQDEKKKSQLSEFINCSTAAALPRTRSDKSWAGPKALIGIISNYLSPSYRLARPQEILMKRFIFVQERF